MAVSLVRNFLKPDSSAHRYYVDGKKVQLGKLNFKAQGGEGAIYVKGSTAFKVYSDFHRAISAEKLQELSVLTQPNIVRPLSLIVDEHNRRVGYTMRYVGKAHALCQLFPRAFRLRNNLTPDTTLALVRKLQAGVTHIHSKQILLVDLNELNFLVAEDFSEIYFIDVDSYQTPTFPATVLMESVRDRHATKFTVGSDFFSFAVVSFQMFVGIHPFKGTYPPLQNVSTAANKLDTRMRNNISVLHAGVTVPASCLPFSVVPPVYLDWYRAVFEEGKRIPPPDNVHQTVNLAFKPAIRRIESAVFAVAEYREFDSEVISHVDGVTLTQSSIYFEGKRYNKPQSEVKVVITPRLRHVIAAFNENHQLRIRDLTEAKDIHTAFDSSEVMSAGGVLYLKQNENVFAIDFIELPHNIVVGLKPLANVLPSSTHLYEGLAIQNLLGTHYISIFTSDSACHQRRLPELDGYQVVNARLERNVLIVVATRKGQYDKFIVRYDRDFNNYDLRIQNDVSSIDINFTLLDSGVVLHLLDDNSLELFSANKTSYSVRTFQDPLLEMDLHLFHTGQQALIARGQKLCKISLQVSTTSR